MNNLFVSYDLKDPGQNYDRVITAIKGLGSWAKVQYSLWYVSSKKLSVNSTLAFRAAFHAVFGRRHGHTQAS